MVKRYGDIVEREYKTFGPEDAGQKVGWSTVVPTAADRDSYYLVGAHATVGHDGATISIRKHETNNERRWCTGLAEGLSRACSYAVLLIANEDVRFANTDHIIVQKDSADVLAGHSHHFERDIDDERVVWGKGDQELTDNLKSGLEQHGLMSEYKYAYLWINGALGSQYKNNSDDYVAPDKIAEVQIFDETMTRPAAMEHMKAKEFESYLSDRFLKTKVAYSGMRNQVYSAGDYLKLREVAHHAHERMKEIADQLVAPKLVYYAPERHLDIGAPALKQPDEGIVSLYLPHLYRIQAGDSEGIADSLEREARDLEQRLRFTEFGIAGLFALTSLGREYINS